VTRGPMIVCIGRLLPSHAATSAMPLKLTIGWCRPDRSHVAQHRRACGVSSCSDPWTSGCPEFPWQNVKAMHLHQCGEPPSDRDRACVPARWLRRLPAPPAREQTHARHTSFVGAQNGQGGLTRRGDRRRSHRDVLAIRRQRNFSRFSDRWPRR
jgi:hypothetical protein